jgi:hypothetical protein
MILLQRREADTVSDQLVLIGVPIGGGPDSGIVVPSVAECW